MFAIHAGVGRADDRREIFNLDDVDVRCGPASGFGTCGATVWELLTMRQTDFSKSSSGSVVNE
jgi:hypothetical protein